MLIKEVMTRDVIKVGMDDTVEEVARLLINNRIHGIPVVEGDVVVGIITETDFFTKGSVNVYLPEYISFIKKDKLTGSLSAEERKRMELLTDTRIGDIMSYPCVTIKENSRVVDFLELVKTGKYITVPVVDENDKLTGIITLSDIMNFIKVEE